MNNTLSYEDYLSIMRSRVNQAEKAKKEKFKEANGLAIKLARFVYSNYTVDSVYIFGSVLDKESFRLDSDIDMAILGLDCSLLGDLREKIAKLGHPYEIDVIRLEDYGEYFRNIVIKEGRLVDR